jgi:hypothetical protein
MKDYSSITVIRKLQEGSVFIGSAEQTNKWKVAVMITARPFGDLMIIEATVGMHRADDADRVNTRKSLLFDITNHNNARFQSNALTAKLLEMLFKDLTIAVASASSYNSNCVRLFELAWDGVQEIPSNKHDKSIKKIEE